jgi:hypothetical protein
MHLHDRREPEGLSSHAQVGVSRDDARFASPTRSAMSVSPGLTTGDVASAGWSEGQLASQKWEMAGLVAWRAAVRGKPGLR